MNPKINMSHCLPPYWRVVGLLQDISATKDSPHRYYMKAPGPYYMPQGVAERLRAQYPSVVFDLTPRINGIWPASDAPEASRGVLLTAEMLHRDPLRWLLPGTTNATPAIIKYDEPVVYDEVAEISKDAYDALRVRVGVDGQGSTHDTSPPATDAGGKA